MTWIQTITLVVAIIGAVCGILGAVLGIINTLHQLSKDKVKLKVIPKLALIGRDLHGNPVAITRSHGEPFPPNTRTVLCVEIINLSSFPVTISLLGFGSDRKHGKCFLYHPDLSNGKTWPPRLKPREAVTAYGSEKTEFHPATMRDAVVYVETDCEAVQYGTSPAFKAYVRTLLPKGAKQ